MAVAKQTLDWKLTGNPVLPVYVGNLTFDERTEEIIENFAKFNRIN